MTKNRMTYLWGATPALLYLVISFFIIKDYGMTWDEPGHFYFGHKYLYFYQTGYLNLRDDIPKIENHSDFLAFQSENTPYTLWSFHNILSAITCTIFYQKLHLLDLISAHHIIIPILTAFFLFVLFLFVKKHWGNAAAFISVLALITYPRFFGHTFNNIKDVPLTIFFSTTIMLFAEWLLSGRLRYLYSAAVSFGLTSAIKMDAILIPLIIFLWQSGFLYKSILDNSSFRARTLLHIIASFFVAAIVVSICFPPLQPWAYATINKFLLNGIRFIYRVVSYSYIMGISPKETWNLYAPIRIFYLTPLAMLVLFISGLIRIAIKFRSDRLYSLLIVWIAFPVLRHCLPKTQHYDDLRHFLVFIVPFSIIISIAIVQVSEMCSKLVRVKKVLLMLPICLLFLIPNIFSLVNTHPFQTTYFNSLIGGLKGAQERNFPSSYDYWLHSYRKAAQWLQDNAQEKANYYAFPINILFKYYIVRKDLNAISEGQVLDNLPSNTYVIVIPSKMLALEKILSAVSNTKIVYQIRKQGGEIITIYYRP